MYKVATLASIFLIDDIPCSFFFSFHFPPMAKPKNPFKRWKAVALNDRIRYYLCTFNGSQVHAATVIQSPQEKALYSVKRDFFESYPMVLEYMGEPSLYSLASVEQWLQNVIDISSEAFAADRTHKPSADEIPQRNPWCYIMMCSNLQKQKIPGSIFESAAFENGQVMKLYHVITVWHIEINDNCFEQGWESYCRDNLIHEYDLLFLRRRGHLTCDALSFGTTQMLTLMPWTLPLPMVPDVAASEAFNRITSSIHPFFGHNLASSTTFYQFYTQRHRYTLALPQYIPPALHEAKTPTINITSGHRTYSLGMTATKFDQNWSTFVADHGLRNGETLLFIPQSRSSFGIIIFDGKELKECIHGTTILMFSPLPFPVYVPYVCFLKNPCML